VNADAGARKWYVFGSGVPRVVIAVSRLTIVISAGFSRGAMERIPPVSAGRELPSKCTSPPNEMVTAALARGVTTALGDGVAVGVGTALGPADTVGCGEEHAAVATPIAASAAIPAHGRPVCTASA
jgi:hypothetical protein